MAAVTGYDSLFDLTHETERRKVSLSKEGSSVVSEGDTSKFKKDEMGKDSFLNLLVAQLKYQDPLNPAEDTQFVAQLAQFSQLEFTQNSTQAISTLASSMQAFMEMQTLQAQSITNASATPLLGKEVRVMEGGLEYKGGTAEIDIHLMDGNKTGTVVIKDKDGNTVAELEATAESSKGGDVKVKWDGKDTETLKQVAAGQYTIEVLDASGLNTAGYAFKDGTVSGVSFSATGAGLTIDGRQYGLGYLVNVEEDKSTMSSGNSNSNVSSDVSKKIASIMSAKDKEGAVEKIAKALGLDLNAGTRIETDDWGNKNVVIEDESVYYLNNEELRSVVDILNKPGAKEDEMIKKLAELLGQEDEEYAEMLKKVQNTLG